MKGMKGEGGNVTGREEGKVRIGKVRSERGRKESKGRGARKGLAAKMRYNRRKGQV